MSFSIVYATTMIVALGGNTLLIYLVWKKPETRNLTSFLFVNMAVADLLIAVFQMPISIAMFYFIPIPCELYYPAFVSSAASIFCLAVMAFDRYFAVVYPFRSSIWFRKPRIITPFVWVSSMALMSVALVVYKFIDGFCRMDDTVISQLAFWSYILVLAYLLPLVVISILYIIIAGKLWLHKMPADDGARVHLRQQEIPKKKVIRMLIIVVVVFAVCWLPVHVYQMHSSIQIRAFWPHSLVYFCYWLSQANSAINPWLYIGLNGKMKAAFAKMIGCRRTGNRIEGNRMATALTSKTNFSNSSFQDTKL